MELLYADHIVLVTDSGMELLTMLEVVQVYMMRWRMKFSIGRVEGGKVERVGKLVR